MVASRWRASYPDLTALFEQILAGDCKQDEEAAFQHGRALRKLRPELVEAIERMALHTTRLTRWLRPYQEFGAKFALIAGRGLLGDEVGLGKTIEALAAIGHAIAADRQRHHLVVCPASLIDNWSREIRQTLSQVPSWAFHDAGRQAAFAGWRAHGGILLTTYLQAEHLLTLALPPIGFAVVDEAHLVKNPDTKSARLAAALVSRADRALLMGGTLMENRAGELIALAGLVDPHQGARLAAQFETAAVRTTTRTASGRR
jgi:SNF2 family DNA or RNA helicase